MSFCEVPHRYLVELAVEVEMVWVKREMVGPVGVDSVVVVLVVEEAVHGKIESCDTLLDRIGDLRSPHPAMIS